MRQWVERLVFSAAGAVGASGFVALVEAGRRDLIGTRPECLVGPAPGEPTHRAAERFERQRRGPKGKRA